MGLFSGGPKRTQKKHQGTLFGGYQPKGKKRSFLKRYGTNITTGAGTAIGGFFGGSEGAKMGAQAGADTGELIWGQQPQGTSQGAAGAYGSYVGQQLSAEPDTTRVDSPYQGDRHSYRRRTYRRAQSRRRSARPSTRYRSRGSYRRRYSEAPRYRYSMRTGREYPPQAPRRSRYALPVLQKRYPAPTEDYYP